LRERFRLGISIIHYANNRLREKQAGKDHNGNKFAQAGDKSADLQALCLFHVNTGSKVQASDITSSMSNVVQSVQ